MMVPVYALPIFKAGYLDVWDLLPADADREGVRAKPLVKLEEGDKVRKSQ